VVALCGLGLSRSAPGSPELAQWLEKLRTCTHTPHVRSNSTSFTEGHIIQAIHSPRDLTTDSLQQRALSIVKRQLVTKGVRPNLILMFDSNLAWAREHLCSEDVSLFEDVVRVYNGELPVRVLDRFERWETIVVPEPPQEDLGQDKHLRLLSMDGQAQTSWGVDGINVSGQGAAWNSLDDFLEDPA
jgi:hypothetical protein